MNIIKKLSLLAVLTAATTLITTGCSSMCGKCSSCSGMSAEAKADHCAVCGGKLGDMTCTTNYMGHTITCCSPQCMQMVNQNPDKYVAK